MPLNDKQKGILMRRKPSTQGDGQNSKEVQEMASQLISKGFTRQAAYAKARRKYKEEYRTSGRRFYSGGGVKPK